MTKKQEKFCSEYGKDLSGKNAAIRAGYNPKSLHYWLSRLAENKAVIDRIRELHGTLHTDISIIRNDEQVIALQVSSRYEFNQER